MGREVVGVDDDPQVVAARAAEPDIGEAGKICVSALRELESTRPMACFTIGMAGATIVLGSIPSPEIRDWCAWRGLGQDETVIVVYVLRRLDGDRAKRENRRLQQMAKG